MKRGLGALGALALAACVGPSRQQRADEQLTLAQKFREDHKIELAAESYEHALDLDPTNVTALRGYVELSQKAGRLRAAEERFSRATAKSPGDAYAHEGLGLVYYAMGGARGDEAKKELTEAAKLAPEVADFHYRLGVLLVDADDWETAKNELATAVREDDRRARYRLPYAVALARTGSRDEAVKQLAKVLELSPTHDEVVAAEKAARMLVDPFRGFPQAAREQFELALGWLDHDSLTQAQQVFDSLLEKFPDLAIVHAMSGLTAAKMDDAGRAISEFRKAIELDPDLAEPRLYLGDLYFARGRPDNAREHYEAALARNPFLADAYKRLGEAHLKGGEKDEAANRLGTYLLLRPEDFEAQVERATLLGELGRPEAQAAWDDMVETFPRRPEALVGRARWYFGLAAQAKERELRRHAWDESKKSLDKVLEVDPDNATAAAMLSELNKIKP